ncbi:sugar phosphate isomerase/epimerase family protein [Litorilituus lipolyticus]|uniref:Sugar phosphate isomerase/epimerase n=1 Tax=Litorilituus lipolyticus TaxID=2491017 RepID=A0A502L049_9GAMM|nr:sugar phosphate isomerase/epimerase [Litorilituus lipolyticus]TPH15631.1 sugar phosphate isomerase/epimerase [Litorilituus lipolyticus]
MNKIQGPAIFLAQFMSDEVPFNNLNNLCKWAASLGYKAIQLPTNDPEIFHLEKAARSQHYCDEIIAIAAEHNIVISELSTHIQGQLVALHPAYTEMFSAFIPEHLQNDHQAITQWATSQLLCAAQASMRLGLKAHATFSGALMWHTVYPWPQRPAGLVDLGFEELANRWLPILDAFDDADVDVCFELHPGEDLHDGASFEQFLIHTNNHPRANILYDPSHFVLQQLDYLAFIDIYHERIKAFHVKDAEFNPTGRSGVYGGYAPWQERAGRFRSLGDGQIDFSAIFSKLTQYGYSGWAVLEWECCIKHPEDGAKEGANFIKKHIIRPTDKAFDDFAGGHSNADLNRKILGLTSEVADDG